MNLDNYIGGKYLGLWDIIVKKAQFELTITSDHSLHIRHNLPENYRKNDLLFLYCILDAYKMGMKSIKPSLEQCLVFENIEANLQLKDYNQPFKTIIIEYPEEYRSVLMSRYRINPPRSSILHWDQEKCSFICSTNFGVRHPVVVMYISPRFRDGTLEESIVKSLAQVGGDDPDYPISADVLRMCLNLCLFMVNYGYQRVGYANVKQHRFLERKRPVEAKKDAEYFALKQNIKLYVRETYKADSNNQGTHASPKPHWRRGFYRHQHFGENNSKVKMVFIRPIFVCPEKYKGNMSDTEVVYHGKS